MILGRLLSAPALLPIQGVLWLGRTVDGQVKAEIYDEDKVRSALAELELKLDLGELELEAYEAQEDVLLQRLKEIREAKRNGEI